MKKFRCYLAEHSFGWLGSHGAPINGPAVEQITIWGESVRWRPLICSRCDTRVGGYVEESDRARFAAMHDRMVENHQ